MADDERIFRAPRGTKDVLPPESWGWEDVTRLGMELFAAAGYAPVETPLFEHTEVFERGVGEASEVVNKQMYTFTDQGGRSLTLRPEGTAPVMRAVLEHRLERGSLPIKLAYAGPFFRQERPQKGRYRQFSQLGIEAIGSADPAVDAEVIELANRFLTRCGVQPRLLLNSIGHVDPSCRQGYLKVLVEFLTENEARLAPEDRARINTNPLRTFDSKEDKTVEVMSAAPVITEHLCDECRKHFESVQSLLGDVGVAFDIEPRLVRGLDYYTRTAFEFQSAGLGSQNAVGGGGRYDGLAEALGGPSLPGMGFGLGIDRILLAQGERAGLGGRVEVFVVALGDEARREAFTLVTRLRAAEIGADMDLGGRGMKGQMKAADRSGARWAVIIGSEELAARRATLRDLTSGEQEQVAFEDLEGTLMARRGAGRAEEARES